MRTYIKKINSKPEHIRKRIFVGSLIVSMFFVTSVWIFSLGYRFNPTTKVQAQSDIKPFALFARSIKDTYHNLTASAGSIPSSTDNSQAPQEKQINVVPIETSN